MVDSLTISSGLCWIGFVSHMSRWGALSSELRPRQVLHAFISHLASGVDLELGLERVALIGVYRDGMVHVVHSFLSIPVDPYSTKMLILVFSGELPL